MFIVYAITWAIRELSKIRVIRLCTWATWPHGHMGHMAHTLKLQHVEYFVTYLKVVLAFIIDRLKLNKCLNYYCCVDIP